MAISLSDYEEVVGRDVIQELHLLADRVKNRRLQNINSTPVGGGVAEILTRMVPLLRELGIETTWDVIKGDQAFFNVTKAFHNALHGKRRSHHRRHAGGVPGNHRGQPARDGHLRGRRVRARPAAGGSDRAQA